jgi:hypothetical protein
LFVLGAAVLMGIGTVALAVRIYQPDLDLRMVFPFSSFSKGSGGFTGEAGDPERFTAQGTPLGEQLEESLDLGAPDAVQESIGGPTIEPGSAIQLTIEPLPEGESPDATSTSQPASTQSLAGTQENLSTPESTSVDQSTPVEQPTQTGQPVEPTSLPTEIPPIPEPTTAPGFDPNEVLAEVGFMNKGSSPTGEQTVTVYIYNFSDQDFQVKASDVALAPPGGDNLEPLASSPGLPIQVNIGQTVEITFTFPIPASGTGTFKIFTVEFELGDF